MKILIDNLNSRVRIVLLMQLSLTICINGFALSICGYGSAITDQITLPDGFAISVFAEGLNNPRSLALGDKGTVFVGSRLNDRILALVDSNNDGTADKKYLIGNDLNTPNGVAFYKGALYVAEIDKIWRYDSIEIRLVNPIIPELVSDDFPSDEWHGWKFIRFGPNGQLYVPIGAPCNSCVKQDKRYASITRLNPDGTNHEIFAEGIRNTVGFDFHPESGDLWFTDNGMDMLGDDIPPDELNRADSSGMFFGFPYCHGTDVKDPKFENGHNCDNSVAPAMELGAHVAALGMRFYTGEMFPREYHGSIFIAEHGSWNRTSPVGYRITVVKLDGSNAVSYEVFASGWLQKDTKIGRPVDLLVMPDGALLVSDDYAGMIYRIVYDGDK